MNKHFVSFEELYPNDAWKLLPGVTLQVSILTFAQIAKKRSEQKTEKSTSYC